MPSLISLPGARRRQPDTGQQADRPSEIPARGWRQIARRVLQQTSADNISVVAAGIAFLAFLSVFPAMAAAFALYGLVVTPDEVQRQMTEASAFLPPQAHEVIAARLHDLTSGDQQKLGWGLLFSLLLALWSANKGTKALFTGINIAYDRPNDRNFFAENAITLAFTLGGILFALAAVALLVVFPAVASGFGLPPLIERVIGWSRWPLLAGALFLAFALAYWVAPVHERPKWRWITWGSTIGVLLWLVGSAGLTFYVSNFGDYDETYGSIAAVVILLTWLYLSAFIVLFGAEINSEIERQTDKPTTEPK